MKIKEFVVVEGRDDTIAVKRAVECTTIETHGFGIKKQTWELLKKANETNGLIIFTDPDYSGEEIRRKISLKFPEAKHAYLSRDEARKGENIGIENASDEAIIRALKKAKAVNTENKIRFFETDMQKAGLSFGEGSKEKRIKVGKELGIGYANSKAFLKKLNAFGITREQFERAVAKSEEQEGKLR